MRRVLLASTVIGSLLVLAGTAAAQSYPPGGYPPPGSRPPGPAPIGWQPEQHEHEELYARAYLGLQYLTSSLGEGAGKSTTSGSGVAMGLGAGWSIAPNLIIYGELFANVALSPTTEIGNVTIESGDEASFGIAGLGAGAIYYTQQNFFVSGTLGFAAVSSDPDGDGGQEPYTSGAGPGVSLMAGKEWWMARHNALGVAGQVFFGSQPVDDDRDDSGGRWNTTAFGVVVTASYD
jgi:hypothetical protein